MDGPGGGLLNITLSDQAVEHIRSKGGRAVVDLLCVSN